MDDKVPLREEFEVQDKHGKEKNSTSDLGRDGGTNREWDEHDLPIVPTKKLRSIARSLEFGEACQESCEYHLATVEDHIARSKDLRGNSMWASDSDSDEEAIISHLGLAIERINNAVKALEPAADAIFDNPFEVAESDEENDPLGYTSDNEDEMEGYESDKEDVYHYQISYEIDNEEVLRARSVTFSEDRIILPLGKLFHNAVVFRHTVRALAQRDGFKLCTMINNRDCISCECADMRCIWEIEGKQLGNTPIFQLTKFHPVHLCPKKIRLVGGSSIWVSYQFLHKWEGDSELMVTSVKEAILSNFGVDCPTAKLLKAQRLGMEIIGADHAVAYNKLSQLTAALEGLDHSHKVILERESNMHIKEPSFKGLFLCFSDCRWAFKHCCRPFIALDGWPLGGEYGGVMLTALGLDANDGILPITVYEVMDETCFTWYDFLDKLNMILLVDNGEGYCVMSNGENGVAEALEMKFFRADNRMCAAKVYEQMRVSFPCPKLMQLFWKACRSTSAKEFNYYMDAIAINNEQCHAWLRNCGWEKWAKHCMPTWTKTMHVTNRMSLQFRLWMENYFAQNITSRFDRLARKIKKLMDRRRHSVDWLWKDKLTPVVRQQVIKATEIGQNLDIIARENRSFTVRDNRNEHFHVTIDQETCSCGGWQLSGIPCLHATKCILSFGGRLEDFVDPLVKTDMYNTTYAKKMDAFPNEELWQNSPMEALLPPDNQPKHFICTETVKGKRSSNMLSLDLGNIDGCQEPLEYSSGLLTASKNEELKKPNSQNSNERNKTYQTELGEKTGINSLVDEDIELMCLSESEGSLEF